MMHHAYKFAFAEGAAAGLLLRVPRPAGSSLTCAEDPLRPLLGTAITCASLMP